MTMEKSYRFISWFFVALFAITVFGFKNYFLQVPKFKNYSFVHHIHLLTVFIWFVLLFIQPILIYKKKIKLHRALGKASYFFVPVMVFFMLLVMKAQYIKMSLSGVPPSFSLAFLYLPTAAMLPFVIIYILGISNKQNPKIHMRYMIATAVSLMGPGIGRIHFGISNLTQAIMFAFALADLILIGLILYEFFKTKIYKPYIISLLICLFFHGLYPFFPSTELWQLISRKFVLLF